MSFVLGALHPEDLAHIPETPRLIASGFGEGIGLKLVDTRTSSLRTWYSGSPRQVRPDVVVFPGCPTAPDPTLFNAHGISLRPAGASLYTLHVVNHGGRESIEVFVVDAHDPEPTLTWRGCGSSCASAVAGEFFTDPVRSAGRPTHSMVDFSWVERGTPPTKLIGSGTAVTDPSKALTHPLCPYPQTAHYRGSGDPNDAANFTCRGSNLSRIHQRPLPREVQPGPRAHKSAPELTALLRRVDASTRCLSVRR